MISQEQIKKKALTPWHSGAFLSGCLRGQTLFPLEIRFRTPSGKEILERYETVRTWIQRLEKNCRDSTGRGYEIAWNTIQHRTLGEQKLPQRIFFATSDEWLCYIKKEKDYQVFSDMVEKTQIALPELLPYLADHPLKALAKANQWMKLLSVCQWFKANPQPQKYIRQLDIVGVDTKFIEAQKAILMELLPLVLAPDCFRTDIKGLSQHGFERKFGLKYDPPLVRFRILDHELYQNGLSDLTLPLAEFAKYDFGGSTVFITENKINGLSFPEMKKALVIFGLGYGVEMLQDVGWLKTKAINYWGDIDTHGYAILSKIRSYFPKVCSMLMDRQTLLDHKELWGQEDPQKIFSGDLSRLTHEEEELFQDLKLNELGLHIRLEQERIRFTALLEKLGL